MCCWVNEMKSSKRCHNRLCLPQVFVAAFYTRLAGITTGFLCRYLLRFTTVVVARLRLWITWGIYIKVLIAMTFTFSGANDATKDRCYRTCAQNKSVWQISTVRFHDLFISRHRGTSHGSVWVWMLSWTWWTPDMMDTNCTENLGTTLN